jgi:HD-like signal output (HDOD) protein
LAGMIHDVGILVSLQVWPENLAKVCEKTRDTNGDFCAIEREMNGADHQQLGAALTQLWKFPRPCQLVAGYHHQPMTLSDDNRLLVTLVFVADTMCAQRNHGFNLTALYQKIDDAGLAQIGLDAAAIERVGTNLPQLIQTASNVFS